MQDEQGNTLVYTSPSGGQVFRSPDGTVFAKIGPAGKESFVYSNVYKDRSTGELVHFNKLDKTSPKPSADKFEPMTKVAGKRHTKKRSTLKLRKIGQKRLRRTVSRKRLL